MRYIFFLLIIFLFVGRTEINDVFPYVHVEYPFRGLFVVVGIVLIAYYSNQILNYGRETETKFIAVGC